MMENIKKPQLEDGYTSIANEIVEKLGKLHLSGNEWQIVWIVLRKTYGWHKKSDQISLTQFQKLTGLSRPSVWEAIGKLVGKKVLVVKKEPYINEYSFNKLYNQWIVGKKELVGFSVPTSREKGTKTSREKGTHKIYKETIQKKVLPKGNRNKSKKYGNKYVNYVLEAFKKNVGAYPIEDSRRKIAYNVYQIVSTFIRKYSEAYKKKKGYSPTFTKLIDASWEIFLGQNPDVEVKRLKTYKQHLRFMLEKTADNLKGGEKHDKQKRIQVYKS